MVRDDEFDLFAEHGAAEFVDRHLGRDDRTRTGQIRVETGLVVHDADLDGITRNRRLGGMPLASRHHRSDQDKSCG
jgi:hypothetical protein